MKIEFLPEAEEEFREAVRYYETEAPGVGITFITTVRRAVGLIAENPYAAASIGSGIRKKVLTHFPYNILYAIERDQVLIVAVAHQKRRPRYWRARIKLLTERKSPSGSEHEK
ncbi:MAG: type II toxin-antitoxin system RelE/ParE family toxin [Syntrophobacteraceae bacterium]